MASDAAGPPTAAVLLIGNELLSGKIRDENGHFLAGVLRRRGIQLLEMTTVSDDLDVIGAALLRLLERTTLVFTSGGVGPTHDDVTMEAIAKATRRPLRRNAEMEATLREHYGDRITPEALAMADIPEGTKLRAERGWPVLRLDLQTGSVDGTHPPHDARIYMLPGIPSLLRAKIDALEKVDAELPRADGWTLLTVRTSLDESSLAGPLDELAKAFPAVEIGSYPRWIPGDGGRLRIEVQVTLEAAGEDGPLAEKAKAALLAKLSPDQVLPDDPKSA